MQLQLNMEITQENLENWFCGALEGGSNYWCELQVGEINRKNFKEGEPFVDNLATSFFKDDNFSFKVYDAESGEDELELLGEVTRDSIKKALEIMHKTYPDSFNVLFFGDADADHCDIWFQLATMGDVVFG